MNPLYDITGWSIPLQALRSGGWCIPLQALRSGGWCILLQAVQGARGWSILLQAVFGASRSESRIVSITPHPG